MLDLNGREIYYNALIECIYIYIQLFSHAHHFLKIDVVLKI